MERGPQQDPGEDPPPPGTSLGAGTDVADLKDQFEQQQVLIAQLKEMLRKTDQTNVTQEKVDRYASTLSKMTVRAKKSKLKKEASSGSESKSSVDAPVNEKISLLRRQLEENKAKLAERGKSQKGIEEMVSQLKAQFDDSLQQINDTSSNFSLFENKTEYSRENSSEELYNILVIKEKKITDMNAKIQKLEGSILDLQENLKEKDCVIDARTKAITLMTESLSKKGRNTQEALDETKEQMRKMQEDFIRLENEMKARQIKLLDDLRLKNIEIAELEENNEGLRKQHSQEKIEGNFEEIYKLKKEIEDLLEKNQNLEASNLNLLKSNEELEEANNKMRNDYNNQMKDLENLLESSSKENIDCKTKIVELESLIEKLNSDTAKGEIDENQSGEIGKLKKDLDDLNKNMIKIKAEHKKKIKVLNKKIDTFKKLGDLNAHIVKLSEENDSLKEKIAELEEEKGNYQLKMIDSFTKDSPDGENIAELQERVKKLLASSEEQSTKLEGLISENNSLKSQLDASNENLQKLTELQSQKVTSEMTSIQFEELSEKLEKEKTELISGKEKLQVEHDELLDKIEILHKEKLELQSKLDQYVQENMELIDKLEKLSAEKVSSAESIEIVENLTHQEKLELEEYQKNLDPQSGKLKISEEHLEGTPDLDDSVNRLTEETSELLQKIELFTIERREVMEKMEILTNENSQLNLRLKQIENNRDLLTETYEQLQSEKEELDNKIESLENENKELQENISLMKKEYQVEEHEELKKKLFDLEGEYIKLVDENEVLRKELKAASEVVHEKDNLESELGDAKNKIEKLRGELSEKLEEIKVYQSVIEDNKEEFIKFAGQLNNLEEVINKKEREIENYKMKINELNSTVHEFEEIIGNLERENKQNVENVDKINSLEEQLGELKITLTNNSDLFSQYESELEENSNQMKQLNSLLKEMQNRNMELQNMLDNKNEEQCKEIKKLNEKIKSLQEEIKDKDEMFHKVSNEMKEKFSHLQKQTDSNSESLEDIREPLQKRIEELTSKNNALVEKMKKIAANLKKKTQNCQQLESSFRSSQEKWETELREKEDTIAQLKQSLDGKLVKSASLENKGEVSLQQELLGSCIASEPVYDFSKIQELELIRETQENDIRNYKERINVLEEMLAEIDEKRVSLEQKTNELGVQLEEKSLSFEEISKTEDILEEKLRFISKCNEEAERKIGELSKENDSLLSENGKLKEVTEKLNQKLTVAQERVNELTQVQETVSILKQNLEESENEIHRLEQELRELELEKTQIRKNAENDLEKLENDYQLEFDELSKEKSELVIVCEKLNEKISELSESEQMLSAKIVELESKLEKMYERQQMSDDKCLAQGEEINEIKVLLNQKQDEIERYLIELESLKLKESELQKQNEELKSELDQTVKELNSIMGELKDLKGKNEGDIVSEKIEPKHQQSSKPIFTWPGQENDPFSFVESVSENIEEKQLGVVEIEPPNQPLPKEIIGTEELLQKIRALEFMLKNVEIERDEILNQCSCLSNELMRFVYEKEGQKIEAGNDNEIKFVESQVVPEDFIKDTESSRKELQKIEFSECKDVVDNQLEVIEEPIQKREAYLCHPQEENSSLDSQILQENYFKESDSSQKELQSAEFAQVDQFSGKQEEKPCLKKETYLCHPDQINVDAFGEDDDGWGWNPEEARLEEKHIKDNESDPLRMKIVQLENKIKNMEIEREERMKEYQELQVKSGKLMKKLKELKVKNDKLQLGKKNENDEMFNLENAIQEELKNQVETLEKKIVEIKNELVKEKTDKQTLEKKVASLSAVNKRMSETKEKQDIEIVMWQRKSEELKLKLDQFEWGDHGTPEKTKIIDESFDKPTETDIIQMKNTIIELNQTIKELTLDNEDLQALLEEQRTLRVNAEKSKNTKTESDYLDVLKQKEMLENEILVVSSEKKRLQDELNEVIKKNDEQLETLGKLQASELKIQELVEERDEILKSLDQAKIKNDELLAEKSEGELRMLEMLRKINSLEEENSQEKMTVIEVLQQEKVKLSNDLAEREREIQEMKLKVEEETKIARNELEQQRENIEKLIQENKLLNEKKVGLEGNLQLLQQQIQERNEDFAVQVEKLNQEWQILVDQRGSDVAESWKLHVDSREAEFGLIQDQLRREIIALEEKCNSLVNENNELRKNVDAEIRNEVDRVSALQQQINERQQAIQELTQVVNDKQLQIEKSESEILQLENTVENLKVTVEQGEVTIKELKIVVETTQKQFDEKRIIVEAVVKQLEERSPSPVLYDLESITKELKRQIDNLVNPEKVSELQKIINDKDAVILSAQNELDLKSEEINSHLASIEELNKLIQNNETTEKLNEMALALTEKEASLTNLTQELNVKLNELENSRKIIEEYELKRVEMESELKSNIAKLSEKDILIADISYQLQQTQSLKENENENVQNLQYSLQQYQLQYEELRRSLDEKNSLIDVMNEELEKQQNIHREREKEVEKLKIYVDELRTSHNTEKDQQQKEKLEILQEVNALKNQLSQAMMLIEELKSEKQTSQESINYLQSQIQEHTRNIEELTGQIGSYRSLNDELGQKLLEYEALQVRFNEEDKQVLELKAIIEDQVLKIEELKMKLYEKSNDYDSLIAQMDVRKEDLKDSGQGARAPMGRGQLIGPTCEDDLMEWVSRSELDIALYMLHQRDVRCEELTVELTQLLEERDTLQLRLSNALREKEELKRIAAEDGKVIEPTSTLSRDGSPSKGAIQKGRVSEILLQSSGTELATEAQESPENQLQHKLSELKNIGYKKDKTLLDDQQQRRLQQISIMQQHLDEASRLPAEAAARLVDANYTLSRDVQSPSTVLLNWLWGRSTPKVNES